MHEICFKNSDNYKPSKIKVFRDCKKSKISRNMSFANSWNEIV